MTTFRDAVVRLAEEKEDKTLSSADKKKIDAKIGKLVKEGKPQKQAVAIAYDMWRSGKL